jgi:hypothetical protein
VLLLLLAPSLPESPRYLLAQGDAAAAEAALQRIAAVNGKQLQFVTDAAAASWLGHEGIAVPQLQGIAPPPPQPPPPPPQQQQQHSAMCDATWRGESSRHADEHVEEWLQLLDSGVPLSSDRSDQQQQQQAVGSLYVERVSQDDCPRSSSSSSSSSSSKIHGFSDQCSSRSKDNPMQPPETSDQTASAMSLAPDVPASPQQQQQQQQQEQQQQSIPAGSQPSSPAQQYSNISGPTSKQLQQQQQQQQLAGFGSQQLQQLLSEARLAASLLSRPPYASTTALLLFAWGATSFAYYGLVQLVAQLHLEVAGPAAAAAAAGEGGGPTCTDGSLQVKRLLPDIC